MSSFLKIKIPSEWEIKKLKDCVSINPENLNINEINEDFINYVDIASIDNSTFQIKEVKKIPISDIPSRARRVIKENDVIISTVRPYLKAFSKVNKEQDNFICSTGFAVLRAKEGLNYEYLFQWILNQKFVNYMISQMVGSSYPAVNMSDVEIAPIILPLLNEQIRIGSILSNVDLLILKTQKMINNLQVLKRGLMQRLLTEGIGHTEFKETRLGKIPKEWEILKLKEIGSAKDGDWILAENYSETGIRLLQIGDIGVGKFLDKSGKFITQETANELNCTIVNPIHELLISRMPDPIGRACIAPQLPYPYIVAVDITIFKPNEDFILPEFLVQILNSQKILKIINRFAQGATRQRISRKELEKVKIPIPSMQEQNVLLDILKNLDSKIENEQSYKNKLKILKKGLMQILLTGKKRVKIN